MKRPISVTAAGVLVLISVHIAPLVADQPTLILVQGAAGADEYGTQFTQWRTRWQQAGEKGGAKVIFIGPGGKAPAEADSNQVSDDRIRLEKTLAAEAKESPRELWLVLIGHGTYDGKLARFNLEGPDVSADELAAWLKPVERPVAIINCASSSGPFMAKLTGENRVIVTATRSGHELNFARFGDHLSSAIGDITADLDKDGQTSLLEAYLFASRKTQTWYAEESRLATEHALLDDNGDGLGTPADWFRGVRAVKQAQDGGKLDGFRASQWCLVRSERERAMPAELRAKRNELELKIAALREKKPTMQEDAYYAALESLVVQMAKIAEAVESEARP